VRPHIVPVRLTDAELALLKERAEREGRTLSDLIRAILFRKVRIDSVGQVIEEPIRLPLQPAPK